MGFQVKYEEITSIRELILAQMCIRDSCQAGGRRPGTLRENHLSCRITGVKADGSSQPVSCLSDSQRNSI